MVQRNARSERRYLSGHEGTSWQLKAWRTLRPLIIFAISLAIVVASAFTGYNIILDHYILPVDRSDDSPVTLEVKNGSSTGTIANLLYDNEASRLIRNKAVFKIYVDFMGKGSSLKAGIYTFDRTMQIPEIVDKLVEGSAIQRRVIKFTLAEGLTIESMADSLAKQSVLPTQADKDYFLELCKTGSTLTNIDVPNISDRLYVLEGYLFPSTYETFEGSTVETVVNMLRKTLNDVMTAAYIERAQELGMTEDQILTLASIIEKEAKTGDFKKVSAVLYNRLKQGMYLQSDATVTYVLGVNRINLTQPELATNSPYNTYINKGLPIGPISNPGKESIEAALWPDETFLSENYLYFCLKEPESGELVFSKTLDEHNALVAQYSELWAAYDAQASNNQ